MAESSATKAEEDWPLRRLPEDYPPVIAELGFVDSAGAVTVATDFARAADSEATADRVVG